jgi:sulfonate transport system substrate-binding protein
MTNLTRRVFVAAAGAFAATGPAYAAKTVRVGYQKYGNLLLLKASGLLEQRLKPLGYGVEWKQFIAGPALMEGLAAGAIDFGTAGETPPIFAQAAGAPLVYLGAEPPAPHGEAILVLQDSPIKTLADLKGKKIALNKGSNVHYLFVKALEKAGLAPQDVTPVYLSPPDGRAAFERKSVDAWVIWDPFLAAAQASGHTRTIVDGEGLVSNNQFYFSSRSFTDKTAIDTLFDAIASIDKQTAADPRSAAKIIGPEMGLPEPIVGNALGRQTWAVRRMDAKLIAEQQAIADTFFKLKLIPKEIKVADATSLT